MTTIAITGASGNFGRLAAEFVLEQVDPSSVVLLTRSPEKLADLAARGAVVRAADFDDQAGLAAALQGVDRLLLISTDAVGSRLGQQQAAIQAAKDAGVGHVVYTSAPNPTPENPAVVNADHRGTEEALQASGLAYTILRNNLYSEYQVAAGASAVASGKLFSNAGDGAVAWVSREDLARVAASVLTAESGHENQIYELGGTEAITRRGLAELLTEVTGRPITVIDVDDAGLTGGLVAAGVPEEVATVLVSFGAAAREGWLGGASNIVEQLTGRPAKPLIETLVAAKDELTAVHA